ncbi:MAG: bifunctional glutamate N-acetyltransferase/amino-acid acetyltransferase ArgJ [Candidatus Omnitrophica bacterium]|nr:bifunctional glutamate N-acetyltransferase/amino-acid acetyltransferase ArgJ [Candidatus Omnitrophota bacterium]
MRWVQGGVTAARGFVAAGIHSGIKRGLKLDLSLVRSQSPSVAVGTLTTNRVKAPPVLISQARLRRGQADAVLLNSGCANCMTGRVGHQDALQLSAAAAREMGLPSERVLVASTGIIGRRLPAPRIARAIPALVRAASRGGHANAARAILTTDQRVKEVAVEARIGGVACRLGGMAKGAGMIAPNMATMLSVITTDVKISAGLARRLLREAVEQSFNRISVDGDMSTNDCVFLLANGRSGVSVRPGTAAARQFARMLRAVSAKLAYLIVQDGEGATRVARIEVAGARTDGEALVCARAVATSSLVQTMLASGDPNVGRIAAAAGASGARFDDGKLAIRIGGHAAVARGVARRIGKELARQMFGSKDVVIHLDLGAGRGEAHMTACDLTEAYVRINAFYPT